ncbi:MAG: DNA translocase FtsK, partial [Planctomycetota bacterium]
VLFLPCLFSMLDRPLGAAGGIAGILMRDAVRALFPDLFAFPLVVGIVLFSLVVSTDWLFYGVREARAVAAPPRRGKAKKKRGLFGKQDRPVAVPAPLPALASTEDLLIPGEPDDEDEDEEEDEGVEACDDEEYEEGDEEEDEEEEEEDDEEYEDDEYEEGEDEDEEEEEEDEEEPAPVPAREPVAASRKPKRPPAPLPGMELLSHCAPVDIGRLERSIQKNSEILERSLASFKIEARVVGYERGPAITMYELALHEGIKLSQIVNLSDDLAIALKAESVRIVAPIPGKSTVGVEVPNAIREDVRLRDLVEEQQEAMDKMAIPLYLGRNASGAPMVEDLAEMPHLLIAGATGSGKSVCINSIIVSILLTRRPEQVRLILIDPKQVELAFFREIPHLLTAVVTDVRKAAQALDWVVNEMEDRYWIFARFSVRNIRAYNHLGAKKIRQLAEKHDISPEKAPYPMPYLTVIVDELADLIMTGRKEIEHAVTRLAQKSRAVGIHSVLATQRPSTDVITGLIKANMPCRAAFKVTSKVDSRVVLDQNGAEKLLGKGDMLFLPPRSFNILRSQGTYVGDDEVKKVVAFMKEHSDPPELRELVVRPEKVADQDPREVDELFEEACRIVIKSQRGSASLLQRALSVGYTRASRLVDLMRGQGIIGEYKNAQAAEVLMTLDDFEEMFAEE